MINLKERNESIGNQNLKDKFNNKIKSENEIPNFLLYNRKFDQSYLLILIYLYIRFLFKINIIRKYFILDLID